MAWTFFSGDSRRMFQTRLPVDQATWAVIEEVLAAHDCSPDRPAAAGSLAG